MNDTMRSVSADLPAALGAAGLLTIDLGALRENYIALDRRAAPARAAAVVKADAYGLGADKVVPVLLDAGCRDFFVAHFSEALRLRPLIGQDCRLFVLNGLLPGDEPVCADAGVIPVLNGFEQVEAWKAEAKHRGAVLPAALQFDTGMARLGLSLDEARALAADPAGLEGIRLEIVMSHLACADEPDNAANAGQLAAMLTAAALFPETPVCFANSGGLFLSPDYRGALCRPGIALYGGNPQNGAANPGKPVVTLSVAVVQARTVPAGTAIGYGGTLVADRPMRLAVISAGYADGIPRSLSNRGSAWYDGVRLPIAGRVSMDSIILDITALPEGTLKRGDMVELIGDHQTLEQIAADAGTISYEILTSLGKRYRRVYRNPQPLKA
ncbi:alanine racemase [Rhizobiaceae bacterium BDR2-2]|uniref:Alanine racemase n=1 Tax=Ectorhizobium quercum TaxID=2965071 RepID=A0AAE3SUC9_9HYPH|nr:alanine racemase [Ectorhizobium quercum]MCX8996937.1 alanine racemase [Ectorhizobium quercum]